jgi:acetolactate synthase I/II/III large subunit
MSAPVASRLGGSNGAYRQPYARRCAWAAGNWIEARTRRCVSKIGTFRSFSLCATNLATGVGCAYLDRSALIAITCNLKTDQLGRRIQMWIDHHALFAPITKATFRLENGRITQTVQDAICTALAEPRGPVHLDLPEDVALAPAQEKIAQPLNPPKIPVAHDAEIKRAGQLIAAARRPIAVLGSSAMRINSPDRLRDVVERHGLPFATTTMAKGNR